MGRARATVTRRLSTIAGFYRYALEEELLDRSPAAHVRRPRVDYESHAVALDRNELGALLVAAGLGSPAVHALISLLALNGLRVSEATGADIEHLGLERGHRTLIVTRKGGKVVTVPLAPRTARAIDLAIGERTEGPVFLARDGRRLDRHGAGRIVRTTARRAGIGKQVTPHTLRHAFITAALDAGVPLRDVQEAASHADPRTTMRYDRARGSLDRHATYIVAAELPGSSPQLSRLAGLPPGGTNMLPEHGREGAGLRCAGLLSSPVACMAERTTGMSASTSAPDLSWLADSPMFIDGQQIGAFYDAVVGPAFRTVELQITAGLPSRRRILAAAAPPPGCPHCFPG